MSTFDLQIGKMPEFVRVKLMQVDFGAQSPARDPYCAVSIKEAVADAGKFFFSYFSSIEYMLHFRQSVQCNITRVGYIHYTQLCTQIFVASKSVAHFVFRYTKVQF